jgi:hypothetical protein
VDITSGGTPGPRLTGELTTVDNNVYGTLPGSTSAVRLAESFVAAGWRARATSSTDYEIEHEWACVELQQLSDQVIFSGVVDPDRLEELVTAFADRDPHYSIELWDNDSIVVTRRS